MRFDIQTKEVEVNGKKVPVDIGVYTLENGKVYTEAVNQDELTGEEVYNFYDEELDYFLKTEEANMDKKIEEVKAKALAAIKKKLDRAINKEVVVEHMMENAYDDYVGWGGEYEAGIVDAFDKYLRYIVENEVNRDYHLDI